jgi:3-oxoacyl-[acyl-carrier protein] reductase
VGRLRVPHRYLLGLGNGVSLAAQPAICAAAKAGIVGLVRNLAVDYGPDGITANAVAPGIIETPQSLDPVNSLRPEGVAAVAPTVPLRRVGRPEDIAHLYCFLASRESEYLTGQLIIADGGWSLVGTD